MKNAIRTIAWTFCIALGGSAGAADVPVSSPQGAQASQSVGLEALLKAGMAGGQIPAMGALLIRNGRVTETAVLGLRAKGGTEPVQPGDVWHLGSNGKAMTATMVARLVERGLLSWDAPLSRLLPDLAADMQVAYRDVTLRDLFAHQSGMQANIDESWVAAFQKDQRPLHEQRLAYARIALAQSPAYVRGAGEATPTMAC